MNKSLRATTIIPESLYVEREADRQLDVIINDMGRPGYVLVARQMGKTNLLIHMKKRREVTGDIVAYFDLSNRFESARALFRHVVDTLIETSPQQFSSATIKICDQRKDTEIEPNIEYDRHLRMLLREVENRKVIIILDEIDSLTSVPYSDLFFAQIRSMYFSRVNYPEYDRLTYVLSGVAEPADLIKDKNISPFNIGEKIYLDDFNQSEFSRFLSNAGLRFSADVVDEIYSWTGGNPRMSWDVCSQLEDMLISGLSVQKKDVSFVIEKLYLTRFDQAPIDHIRVLAESDAQIRNAITSIRWGKEDTLDEKTKNRLYLAGISRSNPGERAKIKNRIIEAALSDEWLNQVALSHKGRLEVAGGHFDAGRYKEAIKLIEEYLQLSSTDKTLPLASQFQLGVANYFVENYDIAVKELRVSLEGDLNEESRTTCKYYLASSLLRGGKIEESIRHFREASTHTGQLQMSAKLALGSALLAFDVDNFYPEIIQINEEIISDVRSSSGNMPTGEASEMLAAANFNIAQTYQLRDAPEIAYEYFGNALAVAPVNFQPAILLRRVHSSDFSSRTQAAIDSAKLIVETKLRISEGSKSALDFNESVLASTLLQLALASRTDSFENLLLYAQHEIYNELFEPFDILLKLYRLQQKNRPTWINLVRIAVEKYSNERANSEEMFEAIRQLALYSESTQRERTLNVYLELLEKRLDQSAPIAEEDLVVLLNYGNRLIDKREYRRALKVLKLSHLAAQSRPEVGPFFAVVRWYQEFMVRNSLNEIDAAREAAKTLLKKVEETKLDKDSEYADTVSVFSQAATKFLNRSAKNPFQKIGRNERIAVKDMRTGEILEAKFKKVENGLREGIYTLVERVVERNK